MTPHNKLKYSDRLRRTCYLRLSDSEYPLLIQAMTDTGHTNMNEFLRSAVETYAGKKIFRERQANKITNEIKDVL